MRLIDLTGQKFGQLKVLYRTSDRVSPAGHRKTMWRCQCDCGRTTNVSTDNLRSGKAKTCGHDPQAGLRRWRSSVKESAPGTNPRKIGDKPPRNNTSGYRNIAVRHIGGRIVYEVGVMYKRHKTYGGQYDNIIEALKAREELRSQVWPGYQAQQVKDIIKTADKDQLTG